MAHSPDTDLLSPSVEPFMAFAEDDDTRRCLHGLAQEQNWDISRVFQGGVDFAVQTLQSHTTPEVLIVDLSNAPDPLDAIMMLAEVCEEGVRLVALGQTNDVQLYRTLMDMGVDDYLLKPVSVDMLNQSIERILTPLPEPTQPETPDHQGEVLTVVGLKGGCGASSFALNSAWYYAHNAQKKTALVDLDLYFSSAALALDLEAGKGFREALENPSRMDSLFLERSMVRIDDSFHLLCSETDLATPCHFTPEAVEALIDRLRPLYEVIIIDMPRSLWPDFGAIAAQAGRLAVLSDLSLTGMRDSLRFVRYGKDQGIISDDMLLIANRVGENKDRELSKAEFEKGIEHPLHALIPFDPKGFGQAELSAVPLVKTAPKSKAVQALQPILSSLLPNEDTPQKTPSLWQRLIKK